VYVELTARKLVNSLFSSEKDVFHWRHLTIEIDAKRISSSIEPESLNYLLWQYSSRDCVKSNSDLQICRHFVH
jgi:hypothetical protein